MKPTDMVVVVATLLGAIGSFYFALASGDYSIAIVVGLALPAIIAAIKLALGERLFTASFLASLVFGAAVISVVLLVRWQEHSALDSAFNSIASARKTFLEGRSYPSPPLPIRVRERVVASDYLSVFLGNPLTLAFLAAPAGAGKSVVLDQMVASSYKDTSFGTIHLRLSELKEKLTESRQKSSWGTQYGLGKVLAIDNSASDGEGFLRAICSAQFRGVSERIAGQWPFRLRTLDSNRRRYVDACKLRLERESESDDGLRIFIDDLDEIEQGSLVHLLKLVEDEITRATSQRKLLILLAGRPEVFFTTSKERRAIWAESNNLASGFSLVTATVEPTTAGFEFFQQYLNSCVEFELKDDPKETRATVLAAINSQRSNSKNLQDALRYLDGCGFSATYFRALNTSFNDISFGKAFYSHWRIRASIKHRLPSADQVPEYEEQLKNAAMILAGEPGGIADLQPELYILLYSGLVEVIPVNFGNKSYSIRFQFPQFQSAILQPPSLQRLLPKRTRIRAAVNPR
jgi:hypothetical protein